MRAGTPPLGGKGRVRIAKVVAALYSRRSSNTVRSMGRTQLPCWDHIANGYDRPWLPIYLNGGL